MTDTYTEHENQDLKCNECENEWTGTVSVHDATGVAGTTCPECGKTQEPKRQ